MGLYFMPAILEKCKFINSGHQLVMHISKQTNRLLNWQHSTPKCIAWITVTRKVFHEKELVQKTILHIRPTPPCTSLWSAALEDPQKIGRSNASAWKKCVKTFTKVEYHSPCIRKGSFHDWQCPLFSCIPNYLHFSVSICQIH